MVGGVKRPLSLSTASVAVILAARARIGISLLRTKFIFGVYRAFQFFAFPFLLVYALSRIFRDRRYAKHIGERFGALPASFERTVPDTVWLHAVSVGEVLSAVALIRQIRQELKGCTVFVSCTTLAGRDAAESKLAGLADGVFFAPLDLVWAVRKVIRRIRPAVLVVMETEIWPNLYREAKRAGVGLVVVNGRISDKAFPSYQRWAGLFGAVLSLPDRILVQSEEQRRRYLALGAPTDRVAVGGNLKYDFDPLGASVSAPVAAWLARSGTGRLWIAASTVGPEFDGDCDEDDAVLLAYEELDDVRIIVAPRRPERFDLVAAKLEAKWVRFARRTRLPENEDAPVLLLDSVGEL
ncbi:MAG: glycosyltransferase N-terminal domain-containing protein, partial [Bryobacteraceae bacterium]|nr:glycosyltransferase N-terminal domain-containing protein [Bryobacteraceae bacterium]